MKKGLLIFMLAMVLFSMDTYSQSIADLDHAPSFKGLTIGDPISKHSAVLQYYGTNKGKNSYKVTDSKYLSIFNIKMDEAIVVEKNGKVNAICLYKTYPPHIFNVKEKESLRSSLTFKYGSPNVNLDDFSSTPTIAGDRWQARTVILDIVYIYYGTDTSGCGLRYFLYQREDDY